MLKPTKGSSARGALAKLKGAKASALAAKVRPAATKKAAKSLPKRAARNRSPDLVGVDAGLFAPLTEGERADALRTLLEDDRMRPMAKVGRYRVVTVEPLVVKPPEPLAGRRLARVVIYDYAGDRCVDACVDLERGAVCYVGTTTAQPMLSREEESNAISVAMSDLRVKSAISLGDVPMIAMHYWSRRTVDVAYRRRSAAVVFGHPGAKPSVIAVVDLIDGVVVETVPAEQW